MEWTENAWLKSFHNTGDFDLEPEWLKKNSC